MLTLKVNKVSNDAQPTQIKLNIAKPNQAMIEEKLQSTEPKKITLKIAQANLQTPQSPQQATQQTQIPSVAEQQHMSQANYSKFKDQKQHVYEIPDTYIGNSVQSDREERVLDLETSLFKKNTIRVPEGVERLFIEILSNAGDNSARSLLKGIDPGEISVTMTESTITVINGGIPIPCELHKEEKIYVPELIFGHLMSSSSYDKTKKRQFSSRNGFGSKLTNIFSKEFSVTAADPFNGLLYKKTWRENMNQQDNHIITPYEKTAKAFVQISFTMDFKRFGYEKYPLEAFELYARHAVDTAFTLKIPVSFSYKIGDGEFVTKKFNLSSAKEYAKLYLGKEAVKNSLLYYVWPEGTETVMKKGIAYSKNKGVLPILEVCAVDSPDAGERVSFVNNMWTRNNGVHFESAFKAVTSSILDVVNGTEKKAGKKKKDASKTKTKAPKLTLADVKKHVSLFVNCWIEDPIFDSQSKNELKAPTPKITIDDKTLSGIMKWDLVSRLYAELDAKLFRNSTKTDGKKRRYLSGMDKLQDANKAATSESANCTLYITEGDSALAFAIKLCSFVPNGRGRDYIGAYPLKGKGLNVMNALPQRIQENKEINDLKEVLGLRERVDYTIEENYQTLRYGHLMVLADADADGKHILGLIINLFHCKYPSLLARGYIKYMRTKILEASKGAMKKKFYTKNEYEEWKRETPDHESWELFYYKGLGTSEDTDIEGEARDPRFVVTIYDQYAPLSLRLAFDQKLADKRKEWIMNWNPDYSVEQMKVQPISSFINHEFIQFSIVDVERNIPRFTDGLKISQRKILWAAMKKWGQIAGGKAKKMKVAQFCSYVSATTHYPYGDKSLEGALVGMAQDFVGANNMPYFDRNGQFGNRASPISAAARYIFTRPEWWIPLIFKKEDRPILDIQIEEGHEVEPVTLLPIIPMHLVNGTTGVGSGFSCNIVAYNPLDLVYWIEAKILGLPLPNLIPWYRGFTGTIEVKDRNKKKKEDEDEKGRDEKGSESESDTMSPVLNEDGEVIPEEVLDRDEVYINKNTKFSMITTGEYEEQGKKVLVSEIPVGRTIMSYHNYLKELREKKIITKFNDYSTTDKPNFEIFGLKNPSWRVLKLCKSYGMSNMVLLDNNNKPVKYDTVDILMETFYHIRLGYYHKRKENIIKTIGENIVALNEKIRFIKAVIKGYELSKSNPNITEEEALEQGALLVMGKGKKKLMVLMEKGGFSPELLKVTLSQCTEDEVISAEEKLAALEAERKMTEEKDTTLFWLEDLNKFTTRYCKFYKCEYISPSKMKEMPSEDEEQEEGEGEDAGEKENDEEVDQNESEEK